jgi:hypothetical protein
LYVDDGLLQLVEIALVGSALILEARVQGGSARITKIKKMNERAFSSFNKS